MRQSLRALLVGVILAGLGIGFALLAKLVARDPESRLGYAGFFAFLVISSRIIC